MGAPPEVLQLVGHPVRWRLLGALAHSDRRVRELTELVGEPQNLVSYHLGRLRAARLVTGRRSSADGRDAYYAADLTRVGALLWAAGASLHPGLHALPAPLPVSAPSRVLFLCTGNSARSPIAEALLRDRSGGVIDVHSAGSRPKPLHPNAVRVMREEHGIDLSTHRPTHLGELADQRFDRVITVCDRVREVCPEFPGHPETTHWSIPDPTAAGGSYGTFRELADELDLRIGFLLATLSPPKEEP